MDAKRTITTLAGLLLPALLTLAIALRLVAQDVRPAPQGLVEDPRLNGFDIYPADSTDREAATAANLDMALTFFGWVDFAPGEGELSVVVGCDGNSYPGNGQWTVTVAQPGTTKRIIGDQVVWNFAIGPLQPFREAVSMAEQQGVWCGKPWQDGGTARVSIGARRYSDGQSVLLPFQDSEGVRVEFHDLILADHDATPMTQAGYVQPLYSPPAVLGKKDKIGSPEETQAYYESVAVDAEGKETIWNALQHLKDFKQRYFGPTQPSARAIYFNRGDLGIGRAMSCTYKTETQETACYVENYGTPDGHALFTTDRTSSYEAVKTEQAFATVVMVSRGAMPANAPNKVFFAVYDHQGRYTPGVSPADAKDNSQLALQAPLDNLGYNKFIPGNCLVCHGAQGVYAKDTKQVFFAYFLPLDLQHSFEYYDIDPAAPLSRPSQEASFLALNRLVAGTDLYTLPQARALLNGFYGAPPTDTDPAAWPAQIFQDDFVPEAWSVSDDSRQIYRKVIAPYCRTCHISHGTLHFGTWDEFVTRQLTIREAVCKARDANIMPNAEATLNAFWRSDARAQLVSRANAPGCGLEPYE